METAPYLEQALARYDLGDTPPAATFIRHNENITYRVTAGESSYLLRIHKPIEGFSLGLLEADCAKESLVNGEMEMLLHLASEGIPAQRPVRSRSGGYVSSLSDGTPCTLLEWLPGESLEQVPLPECFGGSFGGMLGRLHRSLKGLPDNLPRYRYDSALMGRMNSALLSAAEEGHITETQSDSCRRAVDIIRRTMEELEGTEDFGLCHSDLSKSNTLLTGHGIVPIDFSLSGYSCQVMDLGMVFSQYEDAELQRDILSGYEGETGRRVPVRHIQPFYALSVLLFIACQHGRFYREDWFPGAMARWCGTIFDPLAEGKQFILN
ncbi:MAG: phosphotransferase enzyme family protein [Oscillospiraceae bacterium]